MRHFIADPDAVRALTSCLCPSSATPDSRADFDTRTSAINVTPTSNGRYDIGQIKTDALWLSKSVQIDEVHALRLVILEWQDRIRQQLFQGALKYDLESHANVGTNRNIGSLFESTKSYLSGFRYTDNGLDFNSSKARRVRLIETFTTERQFLMQCVEFFITQRLSARSVNEIERQAKSSASDTSMQGVGSQILSSWGALDRPENHSGAETPWLCSIISFLKQKLKLLSEGNQSIRDEGLVEHVEQKWAQTNVLEMIHLLQSVLVVQSSIMAIPRANILLAWFRFMDTVGFLYDWDIVSFYRNTQK